MEIFYPIGISATEAYILIDDGPAVKNQVIDRAFRIGQNKNVVVHKFITKGTIEEKKDLNEDFSIKNIFDYVMSVDIINNKQGIYCYLTNTLKL